MRKTAIYRWDFEKARPAMIDESGERQKLKEIICTEMECTMDDLLTARGTRNATDAKRIFAYISRFTFKDTYQRIANELNLYDHTSVMHLIQKAEDFIYIKDNFKGQLERVQQKLLNQL